MNYFTSIEDRSVRSVYGLTLSDPVGVAFA